MNKKAAIWVSAILYIVLGIVAITLILNAGLPLINKMQDRNTISQTKEVITAFDQKIRFVANQGPGALEPFYIEIKSGELTIDEAGNKIYWSMKTIDQPQEPDTSLEEGNFVSILNRTIVKNEYNMTILVNYQNRLNLNLSSEFGNKFQGRYQLSIRHIGVENDLPTILINVR